MAEPARVPDAAGQVIEFASQADFEAWARADVQDPEAFIRGTYASDAQLDAWQAAGRPTPLPAGWTRWRDYLTQRGL